MLLQRGQELKSPYLEQLKATMAGQSERIAFLNIDDVIAIEFHSIQTPTSFGFYECKKGVCCQNENPTQRYLYPIWVYNLNPQNPQQPVKDGRLMIYSVNKAQKRTLESLMKQVDFYSMDFTTYSEPQGKGFKITPYPTGQMSWLTPEDRMQFGALLTSFYEKAENTILKRVSEQEFLTLFAMRINVPANQQGSLGQGAGQQGQLGFGAVKAPMPVQGFPTIPNSVPPAGFQGQAQHPGNYAQQPQFANPPQAQHPIQPQAPFVPPIVGQNPGVQQFVPQPVGQNPVRPSFTFPPQTVTPGSPTKVPGMPGLPAGQGFERPVAIEVSGEIQAGNPPEEEVTTTEELDSILLEQEDHTKL